jgi:asparagine synthase (glutamine-hydrolysing)
MCGIAGMFGPGADEESVRRMIVAQRHRGPDADGIQRVGSAVLGHSRLSIIDLSPAGRQPMSTADGRLSVVFNGEIYNYAELRAELSDFPYRTRTDTEVLLAAYERWGEACLDRLVGMFAFLIWDQRERRLFAARDRFGVKPLYFHEGKDGTLVCASEIKALHAAGVSALPDPVTWATYLSAGILDHSERTFWSGIRTLPPGHALSWQGTEVRQRRWYDLGERVPAGYDDRPEAEVKEEYVARLRETVMLRFRSDVPVGINLSGGLDSAVLLGLVHAVQGVDSDVKAFTFVTNDPDYDELPWVKQMLARTNHPLVVCPVAPTEVPDLARSVQHHQDEPFGGLPTLTYARLFERARSEGVIVLLDGQGIDEQWAGYDYYAEALAGRIAPIVQASVDPPVRPECLQPDFAALAEPFVSPLVYSDCLRNAQYRDARYTKIPRGLRFNDRVSMRASTELREPFLDHRLFELALAQRPDRKIMDGVRKRMMRDIARDLIPARIAEAPKRPVQTPQREWLRGPLAGWAQECIERALGGLGRDWLDRRLVEEQRRAYLRGESDNSFWLWQWINLGLMSG